MLNKKLRLREVVGNGGMARVQTRVFVSGHLSSCQCRKKEIKIRTSLEHVGNSHVYFYLVNDTHRPRIIHTMMMGISGEEEEKDERKIKERGYTELRAVCSLAGLLPEVDVFQVAHSGQSTQLQTLHSVPSHGQLVHCAQSLQHSRNVREVVEREPQAV